MKYAILVYETETDLDSRTNAQHEIYQGAYNAYSQALAEAGVIAGGAALQPPHTATTLQIHSGQRKVQDGPFADTKEQLGGFFIIDVSDLDAALNWAARCPAASRCGVEVRPLLLMNESGAMA